MTTRFSSKIQSVILIGSVLMVSACATNNTGETIANKTDDSAHAIPEKAKVAPPPEPQRPSAKKVIEPVKTVSAQAPVVAAPAAKATIAKITPKEQFVNIRGKASVKSRKIAVLNGGHSIEILEEKDGWLKIKWQKGDAVKQGWLKKRFVEGYEEEQ
jgi:uncharacterized protein YgiM (DUF1202 family)